jgi:hypothetical protein
MPPCPTYIPTYAFLQGYLSKQADELSTAAKATDTKPTEAQKHAGNYRKGKVQLCGLTVSIENPKGSIRSGKSADGTVWKNTMPHHYGYFLGTLGPDKDHVDCFIGPLWRTATTVYVIDQVDPKTRKYDEPKCMVGFASEAAAKEGYLKAYAKGWKGIGAITAMPVSAFKAWVTSPASRKPAAAELI